ncbi:MAG: hypothetical protein JWP35_1645 [Caulobacter sp.]|nr:hypothetical protein [Caulobacter sp.]
MPSIDIVSPARRFRYPMIAVPWTIGLIVCLFGVSKYFPISEREQRVDGVIVACTGSGRDRCDYRFVAAGRSFVGRGSPWALDPSAGDRAVIYFDPRNPSENALSSYSERVGTNALMFLIFTFLVSVIFLLRYLFRNVWARLRSPRSG